MADGLENANVPSLDPFRPPVYEYPGTLKDIIHRVKGKDHPHVYPEVLAVTEKCANLVDILTKEKKEKKLFVYFGKSFASTLNVSIPVPKPGSVLFDVCIVSTHQPTFFLTVVKEGVTQENTASLAMYNNLLAREVTSAIKTYSDQPFALLNGILHESDLATSKTYLEVIQNITKSKSRFLNHHSLQMDIFKWEKIVDALVSAIAVTKEAKFYTGKATTPQRLQVPTLEQFLAVTNNIDKVGHVDIFSDSSNYIMVDIASRLDKSSRTLVICTSKQLLQTFSQHTKVSNVVMVEDLGQEDYSNYTNVVTNTTKKSVLKLFDRKDCSIFKIMQKERSIISRHRVSPLQMFDNYGDRVYKPIRSQLVFPDIKQNLHDFDISSKLSLCVKSSENEMALTGTKLKTIHPSHYAQRSEVRSRSAVSHTQLPTLPPIREVQSAR